MAFGAIVCELCGANELTRNADGTYQCNYCGTKYSLEAARQLMTGATVRIKSVDFVVEGGTLVRYAGEDKNVAIPTGVTTIGSQAFEDSSIESVVLPEGLVAIEGGNYKSSSFMRCRFLKSVRLPKSLKMIGQYAFCRCDSLESIEFCGEPAMEYSFVDCPKLRTVRYADRAFIVPEFREHTSISSSGFGLDFDKNAPARTNYQFDVIYISGKRVTASNLPSNKDDLLVLQKTLSQSDAVTHETIQRALNSINERRLAKIRDGWIKAGLCSSCGGVFEKKLFKGLVCRSCGSPKSY